MSALEKAKKVKGKPPAPAKKKEKEPSQSSRLSLLEAANADQQDNMKESPVADPSSRPLTPKSGRVTPAARPGSAVSHRSGKKNAVEPAVQGSQVSLGSKYAWEEKPDARPSTSQSLVRPLSSMSKKTRESAVIALAHREAGPETPMVARKSKEDNLSLSTKSLDGATTAETQAYVPFVYARNCLSKVVEDMKKMKTNHMRIVNDIELTYTAIEDETQAQFNRFVMGLRDQYGQKVYTFRQVIDVHRLELNQKQQYWDESLMSLSVRNKQLLQDKKKLLIQNKLEYERLDKEKGNVSADLTVQLDRLQAELTQTKSDHEEHTKACEEEKQKKEEENKALVEENERLKQELEDQPAAVAVVATRESPVQKESEPVVVVSDLSAEDRQQMDEERARMQDERDGVREDRVKMEEERDKFAEERRRFHEEQVMLQGGLNNANKERAEWKARYDSLHGQLGEMAEIRAKYEALQTQMTAVAVYAAASSPEDKNKMQVQVESAQQDRDLMAEEKRQMELDRAKWEEEFKQQNGREPEKEDKPDSIRELEVSLEEATTMVASLDVKIETLETLKEGKVPEAPTVEPRPLNIVEPEIKTIEVTVPDPVVIAKLNDTETELEELKKELSNTKGEVLTLQTDLSSRESELAASKANVARLEAEIEALKEQVSAAAVVDVKSDAEVQKLLKDQEKEYEQKLKDKDKEKKAMERDMKKILKASMKQQKQSDNTHIQRLLEITVREVNAINAQVNPAALMVEERIKEVEAGNTGSGDERSAAEAAYKQWCHDWSEEHNRQPTEQDRASSAQGQALYDAMNQAGDSELTLAALNMIHTGAVPEKVAPKETVSAAAAALEISSEKVSELEDKVSELEEELAEAKKEKDEQEEKVQELEARIAELERDLAEGNVTGVALTAGVTSEASGDDIEELNRQLVTLQEEVDTAESQLQEEQAAHSNTRDELEALKEQLAGMTLELETQKAELDARLEAETAKLQEEIEDLKQKLSKGQERIDELEKARLANLPVDAAQEIAAVKALLAASEGERDQVRKDKSQVDASNKELKAKLDGLEKKDKNQRASTMDSDKKLKELKAAKDKEIKQIQAAAEKKEKERQKQEQKKVAALEKKIQTLEITASVAGTAKAGKPGGKDAKGDGKGPDKALQEQLVTEKRNNKELNARIKQMEMEMKQLQKAGGPGGDSDKNQKKQEKILKELEKKLDSEKKKNEKNEANLKKKTSELETTTKSLSEKEKEVAKLGTELATLGVAAKEGIEAAHKVEALEKEVKDLTKENKTLGENFNSERVLRKKYYNMVEDMKGKIRVYCRVRPMSKTEKERGNHSVCKSPDEYTINVDSNRGLKEFQFDQIFMPEMSQEKVFEDSNNLIQSAVDGYNVCIFAYGQTGSGKTFTIIGDKEQTLPGIAPRAFGRIFELLDENKSKFSYKVQVYMLELYNDKLLDLFSKTHQHDDKMDIKKDKKGMVVVQGADLKPARNAKELMGLFEEGSVNRHTASTKMNAESSRSHLVVGIIIETTNKATGSVLKGKLSLVDLAGSERAAKTGASAEQLKEAMSINKSLSALGDVISALSSEQSFIPYRNNKLTMLMQDSLGGNAKTLMFVNVSPADYNTDETVVSLTYASRVKLITNDASKNADNKEIARLKNVIAKMKKGDGAGDEEEQA